MMLASELVEALNRLMEEYGDWRVEFGLGCDNMNLVRIVKYNSASLVFILE